MDQLKQEIFLVAEDDLHLEISLVALGRQECK
jgi:hypothetical protein